jgi:hypothetical protein
MQNYALLKKNEKQFLSITRMELGLFDKLHTSYVKHWTKYIKELSVSY